MAKPLSATSELSEPQDLTGEVTIESAMPVFNSPYSAVYMGRYHGELVAVKVMKLVLTPATTARKVTRESVIWASVRHANIQPFYGIDRAVGRDSFGALISPWCKNGTARDFLDQAGKLMPASERINLWEGVVQGLIYLHQHSPIIIHGDLKPGNILIDDAENPRICDFGLARVLLDLEDVGSGLTTTTEHGGTERYLAPELVMSGESVYPTTASDVYALGCLGLEFVHLEIPHAHLGNNRRGKITWEKRQGLPPATQPKIGWPSSRLWFLISAMWSTDPLRRPTAFEAGSIVANLSFTYPEDVIRTIVHFVGNCYEGVGSMIDSEVWRVRHKDFLNLRLVSRSFWAHASDYIDLAPRFSRSIDPLQDYAVKKPIPELTLPNHFHRLDWDVTYEIFCHFVVDDWEGPFTLILVCRQWHDLVFSWPTLWSRIKLDTLQPDWVERLSISVLYSGQAPLTVTLRLPFPDIDGLLETLGRCIAVILVVPSTSDLHSERGVQCTMVSYQFFKEKKDVLEAIHREVFSPLAVLHKHQIETFVESRDGLCFSYAVWAIYEAFLTGNPLEDLIRHVGRPLITELSLKQRNLSNAGNSQLIKISHVWQYLPFLSHLRSLELCSSILNMDDMYKLPRITLNSLHTLGILGDFVESSTGTGQLVTVIRVHSCLEAPKLEALHLRGIASRIADTLQTLDEYQCLPNLLLTIPGDFMDGKNAEGVRPPLSLRGCRTIRAEVVPRQRCGVTLAKISPKYYSDGPLRFMSHRSPLTIVGGVELDALMRSEGPKMGVLKVHYRDSEFVPPSRDPRYTETLHAISSRMQTERPVRKLEELLLTAENPHGFVHIPWLLTAEIVIVRQDRYIDELLTVKYSSPSSMKKFDAGDCQLPTAVFRYTTLYSAYDSGNRFQNLITLRCTPAVAAHVIQYFHMPHLAILALVKDTHSAPWVLDGVTPLLDMILARKSGLPQLSTIKLEGMPQWHSLVRFLHMFQKVDCTGISILELPGEPHPRILQVLVESLKGGPGGHVTSFEDEGEQEYLPENQRGCYSCFRCGWTTFHVGMCNRFSKDSAFTVSRYSL